MLKDGGIRPLSPNLLLQASPMNARNSNFNPISPMTITHSYPSSEISMSSMPVHLISSDLWEAITGEHLPPTKISQILSYSIPLTTAASAPFIPIRPQFETPTPPPQAFQSNNFHNPNQDYLAMSKDRTGSRNLQGMLEEGSQEERDLLFNALYPHLNELANDQSANFVIQKVCEVATPEQHRQMLQFFLPNIERVVDQPHSCRVLQKFIECNVGSPEGTENIEQIYEAVCRAPGLLDLCLSQNGNHIVQRFIENLPDRTNEVIQCVFPHLVVLAGDNCGCRVVQRLFERYDVDVLAPLVEEVLKHSASLAENQYGNYVVQNILDAKRPEHISKLIVNFKGHFFDFSMHKFASNVVEKVIRAANPQEQNIIFNEILGYTEDHYNGHNYGYAKNNGRRYSKDRILNMIIDQFGNYVMQRIIEFGTQPQQDAIADVVYNNYDDLFGINYAKHVITKLENIGYQF